MPTHPRSIEPYLPSACSATGSKQPQQKGLEEDLGEEQVCAALNPPLQVERLH
jgi:hypothetical protein